MLELLPIVTPNINWQQYLTAANQALGVSLSRSFDKINLKMDNRAFLISANDLSQTSPALDIDSPALRHLTFTFLLAMLENPFYSLLEHTNLHFTSSDTVKRGIKLSIVTGNLQQWKESIALTSSSESSDIREFSTKCKSYFDLIGLGDIWKHYLKTTLKDKTQKLTFRPTQ